MLQSCEKTLRESIIEAKNLKVEPLEDSQSVPLLDCLRQRPYYLKTSGFQESKALEEFLCVYEENFVACRSSPLTSITLKEVQGKFRDDYKENLSWGYPYLGNEKVDEPSSKRFDPMLRESSM